MFLRETVEETDSAPQELNQLNSEQMHSLVLFVDFLFSTEIPKTRITPHIDALYTADIICVYTIIS